MPDAVERCSLTPPALCSLRGHRVTREAVADASSDGLAALELRFSPQFIAGMTGLDADDVIEAVSDAVSGTGLPIEVGLIGIVVRDEGPDSAVTQVRRLLRHRSALVGADLAGDEAGYPADPRVRTRP